MTLNGPGLEPSYFNAVFWKGLAERAFATFLQTLFGVMTVGGIFDIVAFNWSAAGLAGLSAAVYSVVKSLVATFTGDKGTPSLISGGS